MKTLLALLALFSVSAPAGSAFVEMLGYTAPTVSMETGLSLFVAAFVLLMFGSAYAGVGSLENRSPRTVQPRAAAPVNRRARVLVGPRQPVRTRRSFRAPVTF